jgi:RNA polymerase sigma-70 factor, ECF subfamily
VGVIESDAAPEPAVDVVALYRAHVVRVYSYLARRCGDRSVAEELTSETFVSAMAALHRQPPRTADLPWLLGIARHKLVDHWRRREREDRSLAAVQATANALADADRAPLESERAETALATLQPQHRLVLTLRYLDGLPVPRIAELLDRSVHSTESLLARARRALRASYESQVGWSA